MQQPAVEEELASSSLAHLPPSLLIVICQHCPLNTIFTLLATSQALRTAALSVLSQDVQCMYMDRQSASPATRDTTTTVISCTSPTAGHAARGAYGLYEQQRLEQQPNTKNVPIQGLPLYVEKAHGSTCLRSVLKHVHHLVILDLRWAFGWLDDGCMEQLGLWAPRTLRHLVLQRCGLITGAGIKALCQGGAACGLRSLVLHGCGDVGDGSPLSLLSHLEYLDCSWCTSVTSQGVSGVCATLHGAHFRGCDLLGDEVCREFRVAKEVDMAFTRVTDVGLGTLSALPSLQFLMLGARTDNIYSTRQFRESTLRALTAQRPDVCVKLVV